jgi:hypothetical protein
VRSWFEGRHGIVGVETRTDRYLVLPAGGTVGIKLRAGTGLEVKVRTADPAPMAISEDVHGMVESWAKWACHDPRLGSALVTASDTDARWVDVRKSRRLWPLAVAAGDRSRASEEWETCGGHVELTDLEVGDRRAGTLGLEAWGEGESGQRPIELVVAAVFSAGPDFPLHLSASDSRSYPAWLERTLVLEPPDGFD